MSLVSTYVRLSDGKWYHNPVLKMPSFDGSFICFDDEDPPELVCFDILQGYAGIHAVLKEMGIECKVRSGRMGGMRMPLREDGEHSKWFKECATWLLFAPFTCAVSPIWCAKEFGATPTMPRCQGVFMDWSGIS